MNTFVNALMHTPILAKLIALNQAILKIDVEFFDDVNSNSKLDLIDTDWVDNVFTNSSDRLILQDHITSQRNSTNTSNVIQQISEKLLLNTHIMERFVSRENINANTSTQKISTIWDRFEMSDKPTSISQLSNTVNDNLIPISLLSNTVNDTLIPISQLSNTMNDNFISQLSNLEQTLPELHTPTSIKPNNILSKTLEENSIRNSNTTHSSSTNIHIDKVEVNDVSNVNDLALQLQQKVSTL